MRPLKLLIASIVVAACAFVWLSNRTTEPHAAAGPSKQRAPADAGEPFDIELPPSPIGERESLELPSTTAPEGELTPSDEPAATPEFSFWGKLVDGESRRPIAGANVQVQLYEEWLTSDARGLFEITDNAYKEQFVRLDATGFGTVVTEVAKGHDTPADAVELVLWRAATIDARVIDASGAPLVGVIVSASSIGRELVRPEGSSFLRLPGGATFLNRVYWSALTDSDGRCAIEGLAPEVPLAMVVQRGNEDLYTEPSLLTLKPGGRRDWTCRVGSGARVFGVVLDQHESAIANQEVWLVARKPGAPGSWLYFVESTRTVVRQATTDVAGRFELTDVPAGTWWLGPAAPRVRAEPSEDAVSPVAASVTLNADDLEKEVLLRVHRGLYIRGRVVVPNSEATGTLHVFALSLDVTGHIGTQSRDDGTFALGPLTPGEFRVAVLPSRGFAASQFVVAQAGDEDVVLELSVACRMHASAVDAVSGARCIAQFSVRPRKSLTFRGGATYSASPSLSGVDIGGLVEGTYDIVARTEDGRVGVSRDVAVRTGEEPLGVEVQVQAGARLRLRFDGREQVVSFDIVSDGVTVATDGLRLGTSALVLVPAGPALVQLRSGDNVLEERQVTALAGEEVEVVFHRD